MLASGPFLHLLREDNKFLTGKPVLLNKLLIIVMMRPGAGNLLDHWQDWNNLA